MKISRRQFIKGAAAAGVALALPLKFGVKSAQGYAISPGLTKFVDPLPLFGPDIPPATPFGTPYVGVDYYEITAGDFRQSIHSGLATYFSNKGLTYNGTRFYGYKNTNGGSFAHLGGFIGAAKGKPVRIKFTNTLPATYMLPFDPTIPSPGNGGNRQDRIAVHLHGGLVPWPSDGGPFHWFAPDGTLGSSVPPGGWLHNAAGALTNDYYYPNNQSARLMWYHDHAIGITRTNAYAGLASAYIIADAPFEASLGLPAPQYLAFQDKVIWDPANDPLYNQPVNLGGGGVTGAQPGDLWYPYIYEPAIWKLQGRGKAPIPSAVPEMAGDTMLVNGHIFPFHQVTAGAQRFRWLNACNTRFLDLKFVLEAGSTGEPLGGYLAPTPAPVDVWIVGSEGGYLPAPVLAVSNGTPIFPNPLLIGPGERFDVIVDFTGLDGQNVLLYSDAQTPYPLGNPGFDYYPGNPLNPVQPLAGQGPNTRTIMRFAVSGAGSTVSVPGTLAPSTEFLPTVSDLVNGGQTLQNQTLGAIYTVGGVQYTFAGVRNLTLNEAFDKFGRLIQEIGTTVKVKGGGYGLNYAFDAPTENVTYRTVEIWNVFNLTADTHPMHTHLFNVMVLRRQPFKVQNFKGTPVFIGPGRGPEPYEIGWKETFKCPPGEVTVVAVLVEAPIVDNLGAITRNVIVTPTTPPGTTSFTSTVPFSPRLQVAPFNLSVDEYVWHCHILEHEEHDMMRPLTAL
jgi:spore coat protein A, manganese oxidase